MLRFMAYLCLSSDDYRNSQMVIVTGPNQELAVKLIKRMKGLFEGLGITFAEKETVLNLNGCEIQAYPSNHIDAFRSLTERTMVSSLKLVKHYQALMIMRCTTLNELDFNVQMPTKRSGMLSSHCIY
jgi:hypothetical protein